jgi:predicted dehydrogenase
MDGSELRIGLVGAGIFARDAHIPALLALGDRARVVAVWSRTKRAAEECAALLPGAASVMTDLDELLARDDVDAIDAVLPIDAQPEVVRKALLAGKHVISEKPVAPTSQVARTLIREWRASDRVWMVAENYRYEETWVKAAELIKAGTIGEPLTANWALHIPMTASVNYYHTAWRMSGQVGGGFVLDAGVHHVAVLRMLMGEIHAVKAVTRHFRSDLPAPDTLASSLEFASGAVGHYFVTFAAQQGGDSPITVTGSEGTLRAQRGWIEVTTAAGVVRNPVRERTGVEVELAAFVDAIERATPHRNSPEEALRDLEVIEAMFHSAAEEGVRIVSAQTD